MFDLENEVLNWRSRLLDNETMSDGEADELESHLRDAIDDLSKTLPPDEAFWLAVRRTGSPEAVALEFSKINGAKTWSRRVQWMLAGYLLVSLPLGVIGSVGHFATMGAVYFQLPAWAVFASSGIGASLIVLGLVFWVWNITKGHALGVQSLVTRFSLWAKPGNRWRLLLAATILLALKWGAQAAAHITAHKIMSREQYGAAAAVTSLTTPVTWLLVVAAIISALCWLVNRDGRSLNRWGSTKLLMTGLAITAAVLIAFGLMSYGVEWIYGPRISAVLGA